jgi:hypothetical protein
MRRVTSAPCPSWVLAGVFLLSMPVFIIAEGPEPEKVTIKIRPVVLFAGGDVRTTVRAPRDARNRDMRIVVEGTDFYASSDVQLDGVDAATTHQFTWKELPGGAYRVEVILFRANGEHSSVSSCFSVLSGDDDTLPTTAQFPTRRRQQLPKPDTTAAVRSGC